MNLLAIPAFFDLNSAWVFGHPERAFQEATAHAYRPNGVRSVDEFHPRLRVPSVRQSLSRRLQGHELFLLGSISVHGICATDRSRESARHRNMIARAGLETLKIG